MISKKTKRKKKKKKRMPGVAVKKMKCHQAGEEEKRPRSHSGGSF